MSVEMEGLEFQIETTAEEGVKGVDALRKSLSKLKSVTKGGLGLSANVKELQSLNKALSGFHIEKLHKFLKAIGEMGNVKISSNIATQLGNIVDVMERITLADVERLEDMTKALRELGELSNVKIPKVTVPNSGVAPVVTGTETTTNTTPAASGVEQVGATAQAAAQKVGFFKTAMSEVGAIIGVTYPLKQVKTAITAAGSSLAWLKNNLKEMYSNFKAGGGIIGAFSRTMGNVFRKSAAGMASAIKNVTARIKNGLSPAAKGATGKLGQFFNSIKRIAMYRLIRFALSELTKAMREGINNLYQYSNLMGGIFAQSMDTLATSASYLKNSLGAMAAPIINALAPAIDFVIDKIVTLLNYINMLFARLSGATTFTAAKKNAQSYGDSLESAGSSASKAAKEIRDATTGIDELNIIMQKDDTSGGGGGGGADYGSMFEELPIDNSVSEFADKLKQAFDNADWKTLGTLIGGKVNEIIDSIDWAGVGSKIGWGVNGAVQTAYYLLDTINFTNIGTHIAELFNNALEEVDFSYVGRLFIKAFTILPDIIIGGLVELDWGLVGQKIGEFLIGAANEAFEWLNKYNWSELGATLWQKIKDLFTGIDWSGVAQSIFRALGAAMAAVVQSIGSFFGSVWADIREYFSKKIEECGGDIPAGLWKGIKDAFGNAVAWIRDNIVTPFIDGFKSLFGIHSPSTVMEEIGGYITEGLLDGILKPFKTIGNWIKKNILDPLTEAFEDVDFVEFTVGVKNTAAEWWSNVCGWWDEKVGAVQSFTTNVTNNASTWWTNTKNWWAGKVGKVKEFTTSVANQATDWWSKVNTWWDGKVGSVKNFTTSVANHASTWWSNVQSWWSGKVGAVQQFTTSVADHSYTWWENVKSWWSGRVGAVKEFTTTVTNQASTWWNNVKTWWSGKVGAVQQFTTSVKNEASTWWSNVKTWWSGKVGAVQQFTTSLKNDALTWWNNCKSWWSGKVGAVQSFTTNVVNQAYIWWSDVKTWWSGVVGTLSAKVGIVNQAATWWENVKSWWSNAVGTLWASLNIKLPTVKVSWYKDPIFGAIDLPSFSLVWNAKGGILDGAQLFGMLGNSFLGGGEAGKEAVLPLERHTEWMDTLAEKVRSGLPEDDNDSPNYSGFKKAMADFYVEYVQGTMNQMASDMNRQANKREQTTVQIGNRTITDAVQTQRDANGYSFT